MLFSTGNLGTKKGSLVPKCGACGLFKGCKSPKMLPYGNRKSRVLIVGEAPGETEDEQDRPFVGKAGQYLRSTLQGIGVDMDKDALTCNALCCRPPANKIEDPRMVEHCHPNLAQTIQEFAPDVVIPLGATALTSVLLPYWQDIDRFERWVGWQIPLGKFWVCPTYHPSFLLRSHAPVLDREFASQLEKAFAFQGPPVPNTDWKSRIEILFDEEAVWKALQRFGHDGDWVAFDYESNCLKPEYPKAQLYSCAVSNGKRTVAYPWTKENARTTGILLQRDRTKKIAWNLKFEERWTLKEFGYGVTNWGWDGMLAAHCLDNRPGICSLKFQAFVKMGVLPYNQHLEHLLDSGKGLYNRIAEIDRMDLLTYNGMDALLEWHMAMRQMKEMKQ